MGILLMLVGMLGVSSGGLKMRGRVRATVGQSPLAIIEMVFGVLTLAGAGVGLARARLFAWMLVALTLVMTLSSTWAHVRLVSRYVKKRRQSEALRLKTYLSSREYSE
jgi:hypothetical protein